MRSKHFFGLCLVVGAYAAAGIAGTGCGGDSSTGTGTGTGGTSGTGGATSTSTGTMTTTTTTTTTTTGGTGGGTGDGDDTPQTAIEVEVDPAMVTVGTLEPADTDFDFIQFVGKKGDAIVISTGAKEGADPFDTSYADTVVTLYDDGILANPNAAPLAQNDDPTPRLTNDAQLYTVLPKDGTYYVRIAECNAAFAMGCAPVDDIETFDYQVAVFNVPNLEGATGENAEVGEPSKPDPAMGNPVAYAKGMSGNYFLSTVYGQYQTTTDVDVFQFTVPADVTVGAGGRATGYFYPLPSTEPNTNGSGVPLGKMWIVDPMDAMKMVALIDTSAPMDDADRDLSLPLTLDKMYYLFVERPAGGASGNDFYFIQHYGGGSNPLEAKEAENYVLATAETLSVQDNMDGSFSYFVDGNITLAGTDLDHYTVDVPAGLTENKVSIACGAQRSGSGLRNFKIETLKGSAGNGAVPMGSISEAATTDALLSGIAIPAGETKLIVKLTAGSQDPSVTSSFYRCGIHLR